MNPDPAAAARPASLTDATIGIVVSDWHSELTSVMLQSAIDTLKHCGVENEDIFVAHVPSVMELTFAARQMSVTQEPKAVIMLGLSFKEEGDESWSANDDVCRESIIHGYTELNLHSDIPYIFGVYFFKSIEQARAALPSRLGIESAQKVQSMVNMMANLVVI